MSKLAGLLALALVVQPAPSSESIEPRYAPALGTILERRVELGTGVEVVRSETTRDGKPDGVPQPMKLAMLNRSFPDMDQAWVLEDEILAVDAGRPTRLVRTFREMSGVYFATPLFQLEWKGEADGLVLELSADLDPRSLEDPDARMVAQWVPFDLDCARLLPPRAVRVGDAWTVTPEDLPLADLITDLGLLRTAEVSCRLAEVRGDAEDRHAVVAIELAHEEDSVLEPGESDWIEAQEIERESGTQTVTIEGRGELVWSLSRSCAHACSLSIERTDQRHVVGRTTEEPPALLDHHMTMKLTTTFALAVSEIAR